MLHWIKRVVTCAGRTRSPYSTIHTNQTNNVRGKNQKKKKKSSHNRPTDHLFFSLQTQGARSANRTSMRCQVVARVAARLLAATRSPSSPAKDTAGMVHQMRRKRTRLLRLWGIGGKAQARQVQQLQPATQDKAQAEHQLRS